MPDDLDSGVRGFLDSLETLGLRPLEELSPNEARDQFRRFASFSQGSTPRAAVHRTYDSQHADVPIRVYEMTDGRPDNVVVYIHGGGWVLGDLETADLTAREIASTLGCTVVAVGYRLAPEHPYPAAVNDSRAVLEFVTAQFPGSRIAVAGDSAGANLALAMGALAAKTDSVRVDALLLIYPALDARLMRPSHDEFADGYLLTTSDMRWFWEQYLGPRLEEFKQTAHDDRAALAQLPATVVTTAGFDPLQDEGRALASGLVAAGVATTYLHHSTLPHGWLDFAGSVPAATAARAGVLESFKDLLESLPTPPRAGDLED